MIATNRTNPFTLKHNLNNNLTEWIKYGNESFDMVVKDIAFSQDENRIIVLSESYTNTYREASLESSRETPPNRNLLLTCLDPEGAITMWNQIVGHPTRNDTYISMKYFSGELFLALHSYSGYYNTKNLATQDIRLTRIIVESGVITSNTYFGSDANETGLDLIVNHQGIFILLRFLPGLQPPPDPSTYHSWSGLPISNSTNLTRFHIKKVSPRL